MDISPVLLILLFSTINLFYNVSAMIPSVQEYFPDLKGDVTRLEWSHAVNNKSLLKEALSNKSVHMLEADVVYGTLLDGSGPMPIMAHPPANTSDLSLQDFINEVIGIQDSQKKGMKLDFKFGKAYSAAWEFIGLKNLTFPVWLNADILTGPGSPSSVPLDPKNFVTLARDKLPDSTLSLGWTTAYGDRVNYTPEMLEEMLNTVKNYEIQQPITLAVRAAFAARSTAGIQNLINSIDQFQNKSQTTVTIWMSSATDVVDSPKLHTLLTDLGKQKVFLDVPADIKEQILLGNASPVTAAQGALVAILSSVTVAFSKLGNIF